MTVSLRAEGLERVFTSRAGEVRACDGIDLDVHRGELLVVRGRSGAGKTTLLNLLGLLDRPTGGRVLIASGEELVDTTGLSEDRLAELRRDELGFVFQAFGLVPVLSARENVELPLRIADVDPDERDERVAEALARVGLADHAEQRPAELSGGQQQRVGIARAIVSSARILVADEPTGQLDSRTAASVMDLLAELAHDRGLAAIVSTHDPLLVARADRVLEIHDGRVVGAPAPRAAGDAAPGSVPEPAATAAVPPAGFAPPAAEPTPPARPLTRAERRRRAGG